MGQILWGKSFLGNRLVGNVWQGVVGRGFTGAKSLGQNVLVPHVPGRTMVTDPKTKPPLYQWYGMFSTDHISEITMPMDDSLLLTNYS